MWPKMSASVEETPTSSDCWVIQAKGLKRFEIDEVFVVRATTEALKWICKHRKAFICLKVTKMSLYE